MRSAVPTFNEVWQCQLRQCILSQSTQFSENSRFILACSGGMDSMLLLHLLHSLFPQRLSVIHIDHQLQQQSQNWANQVLNICQTLNIDCEVIAVNVAVGNVEQQAREARYQALQSRLIAQDILILAHHQQDQAETAILRLLQGTGVDGLSAMRVIESRDLNASESFFLWRPLLNTSRQLIEQWVEQLGICYINDPMNHQTKYDRVWCREQLWPILAQRFPQMQNAISRSTQLMQDAQTILNEVLIQDQHVCLNDNQLDIVKLQQLSSPRQRQLLSRFMQGVHMYRPPLAMVERIQKEVIEAKEDAQSILQYAGLCFVRFNGVIYRYTLEQWQTFHSVAEEKNIIFQLEQEYDIANCQFDVQLNKIGLSSELLGKSLLLKPRQGGEKIQFWNRTGHRILKKELQQAKIAPWFRHQIQILMYHNVVLGVFTPKGFWLAQHDYCQSQGWQPQLITDNGLDEQW